MSDVERKFIKVKERWKNAREYEKTKYTSDTPEGQAWAVKEIIEIISQVNILWNQMTAEERQKHMDYFEM